MADRAVRRKTRLRMRWIVGVVVIRQVARRASCALQCVITIHVTLRTGHGRMGAG